MNRFPALITFIFIFSSCADHSKNELAVFKATNEGLMVSNQNISISSLDIYRTMEDRLVDPDSRYRAIVWQPRTAAIKELSTDLVKYITGLKNELTNGKERGSEEYKKIINDDNNDNIVRALFDDGGKGEELYLKLKKYKRKMLAVDSEINAVFEKNSIAIGSDFEADENKSREFTKTYFHNTPVIAALSMLSKFENDARVMENQFIMFCLNKSYSGGGCGFSLGPQPLIAQSSSYAKCGDIIEITAGIGLFTAAAVARVIIKSTAVPVNENGVAIYRFKTPLIPGKYFVPVKIEYTKPDGTKELTTRKIEYTVTDTCK